MHYNLKVKTIINIALVINEFFSCVFSRWTIKEMWDTFQLTHEGTIDVNRVRMNTLTHEYKFFKIKHEENI